MFQNTGIEGTCFLCYEDFLLRFLAKVSNFLLYLFSLLPIYIAVKLL